MIRVNVLIHSYRHLAYLDHANSLFLCIISGQTTSQGRLVLLATVRSRIHWHNIFSSSSFMVLVLGEGFSAMFVLNSSYCLVMGFEVLPFLFVVFFVLIVFLCIIVSHPNTWLPDIFVCG